MKRKSEYFNILFFMLSVALLAGALSTKSAPVSISYYSDYSSPAGTNPETQETLSKYNAQKKTGTNNNSPVLFDKILKNNPRNDVINVVKYGIPSKPKKYKPEKSPIDKYDDTVVPMYGIPSRGMTSQEQNNPN